VVEGYNSNLVQVLWSFFVILDRHQSEGIKGWKMVLAPIAWMEEFPWFIHNSEKMMQRFLYFDGLVAAKPHEKR